MQLLHAGEGIESSLRREAMLQVTTTTDSNEGVGGMCSPSSKPLRWNGSQQMRDEGLALEKTRLDDNQVSRPKTSIKRPQNIILVHIYHEED